MNLQAMSVEQLRELNEQVCAELSARRTAANAMAIRKFAPGDKCFYKARGNTTVFCTFEKPLRTNVDVITTSGRQMRVPAALLQFSEAA